MRRGGIDAGITVIVTVVLLFGLSTPSLAESLSLTPASGTPQLYETGTVQTVRQLVQCGSMIYAVGAFTKIEWHGTVYDRSNAFSFSAISPFTVSSWDPDVKGEVDSVALSSDCTVAYLGGSFSGVGHTSAENLAAVKTSTGDVISSFGHSANGEVDTLLDFGGRLIAGGYFTSVNGSRADPYMASLNTTTGENDGFVSLGISGNYHFCVGSSCAAGNPTRVYNQQLSPQGGLDLVEGDFTSVAGEPRQQVFMINLNGAKAVLTGWNVPLFDEHCQFSDPFYVRAASWSPNGATIYAGSTGLYPDDWNGTYPMTGPCDAAMAFPATETSVHPIWMNYTGCNSLYATAASATVAYFGGHEQYSENADGCKFAGPGAVVAPGIEGLSAKTGQITFNPTRGRGHGADDMVVTTAGLWIASDNFDNTNECGHESNHAGICFFRYS
jgi:hypothetical protein